MQVKNKNFCNFEKKHRDLFKVKFGYCNESKVKLRFKYGASKRNQCKTYGEAENHKKWRNICEHKSWRKADSVEWLSPVFCQGKSRGGIRLLTYFQKLNESLERDEWSFETIDSVLHGMGTFNHATTLDQVIGHCAMQVEKEDQTHLGIIEPCKTCICNTLPQGLKTSVEFYQK